MENAMTRFARRPAAALAALFGVTLFVMRPQ